MGLCSQVGVWCVVLTCCDCRLTLLKLNLGWQGDMVGSFSQVDTHWVQVGGVYVGCSWVLGPVYSRV
jgi:hypothetical protein